MENQQKTLLFEEIPIPRAVATLAVPTVLSSLVMVLYNLADTYFVGMCNDPVQNAAVALKDSWCRYEYGTGNRSIPEMDIGFWCSSVYIKCGTGLHGTFRRFCTPCQHRNHEWLCAEYYSGSDFYFAMGTKPRSRRSRTGDLFI